VTDIVNSPAHYISGGIETIDFIRASLSPEEFRGYCKGNGLKYLSRALRKGDELNDLRKCRWYLNRVIDVIEAQDKLAVEIDEALAQQYRYGRPADVGDTVECVDDADGAITDLEVGARYEVAKVAPNHIALVGNERRYYSRDRFERVLFS
jgi:hypothetical protein